MLWDKKSGSTPIQHPELLSGLSGTGLDPDGKTHLEPFQQEELTSENAPKQTIPTSVSRSQTILGQEVIVKGDLSGKEDLLIEGQCEGSLDFPDHCLTVGPQGQVKSEIHARQVVIHGTVNGRILAKERVEIRKTGTVVGDIVSATLAIEDGAFFKGSIEIVREGSRNAFGTERPEATRAVSAVA